MSSERDTYSHIDAVGALSFVDPFSNSKSKMVCYKEAKYLDIFRQMNEFKETKKKMRINKSAKEITVER